MAAIPTQPAAAGALLSPADSERLARPLRAWRDDQRLAVQAFFEQLAADWHRDWCLAGPSSAGPAGVADEDGGHAGADALPCVAWRHIPARAAAPTPAAFAPTDNAIAGGRPSPSALSDLCRALFGDAGPQPGSVALEVAHRAWGDWWLRMNRRARLPRATPRPGSRTSDWWSGKLQVRLPWCAGTLVLELEEAQARALLESQAPALLAATAASAAPATRKTSIAVALAGRGIELRAMLGGVELSLRQLQSLRVGDVVPLEHRLDEPALVESTAADPLCRGWLGQQDGHVAVEMVRR